ncbi:MAG: hypothetical protein ACE5J4_02210 [Candidatus Aenigmatarchaeota archaeon]
MIGFLIIVASPLALAQKSEPEPDPYAIYPDGDNIWGTQIKYGRVMAVYFLTLTKLQLTGPYDVEVDSEKHRDALVNKIETTIKLIKNGNYKAASNKIENDIIKHGEKWILTEDYLEGTRYEDGSFSFKSPLLSAIHALEPEYRYDIILDRDGNGLQFIRDCGNCVSLGPWCKYVN